MATRSPTTYHKSSAAVRVKSGADYRSGSITYAGTGTSELSYLCAGTGNTMSKVSPDGCGYGIVSSVGYVSVAIPTPRT